MASRLDFSSTEADLSDLLSRSLIMLIVWVTFLSLTRRACNLIASVFWSHPIPVEYAFIPSKLPHPNVSGSAIPFDIPLLKAKNEDIERFMRFLQKENTCMVCEGKNTPDEKWTLKDVVVCAAAYKGQLYEERAMKWIDDHFRLKLPNLKYPYVDRHWNGWSSFWLETGPHIRLMFLSGATVIVEHVINGLIFPMGYLITHNLIYYNLALYGEVAYMVYSSALICLSYYWGRDMTIEQMHPAVWPLLLLHHISSLILCIGCILLGDSVPKKLVCWVLLSLLGLTSSLHYVSQILDFSPISQADAPYTRLFNHILCLASQIMFRVVNWVKICYLAIRHCLAVHGVGLTAVLLLVLLLFTLFNLDFVRFHIKATRGCLLRIQQMKDIKSH